MRIALEVVGVPEAVRGIEQGVARMEVAAYNQMRYEMVNLRNYTLQNHMHGPTGANTVQQRTGNLARSLVSQVEDENDVITGVVGFPEASPAPYARILHEGGTTRAHVIEAENARTLAFMAGGRMIFRRKVNHPGSRFPARPYLTSALEEQAEQIKTNLKRAIVEAGA